MCGKGKEKERKRTIIIKLELDSWIEMEEKEELPVSVFWRRQHGIIRSEVEANDRKRKTF